MMAAHSFSGFDELKAWALMLPDQVMGRAGSVCETGEPYREFLVMALARPDDVKVIERHVANQMAALLEQYFESRKGRIYWRKPLEFSVSPHYEVVSYDENGPDTDFLTDRRCIADKNWMYVACYCRLYRASQYAPALSRPEAA